MTLDETTKRVQSLFANADGFADTLTFDFGSAGVISVDGTKSPPEVSNQGIGADCTISVSLDDFASMLDGSLDPQMAFMSGKLSIDGNMGIAMNLSSILKN